MLYSIAPSAPVRQIRHLTAAKKWAARAGLLGLGIVRWRTKCFVYILLGLLSIECLLVCVGCWGAADGVSRKGLFAQPVSSPYTAQEIGEFSSSVLATNLGMGQVGVALMAPGSVYGSDPHLLQPALLSSNLLTQIYFGMSSDTRTVRSLSQQQRYNNIQLGVVVLSVPIISKQWGLSLSLLPYTQMNYYIQRRADVENTSSIETTHNLEGQGGLNRFSLAQGVRITDAFRVGCALSYYFGYTERTDVLVVEEENLSDFATQYIDHNNYQGLGYELGLFYSFSLSDKQHLNIGATISPSTSLRQQMISSLNRRLSNIPTANVLEGLSRTQTLDPYPLPLSWRIGLGYQVENNLNIGLDLHRMQHNGSSYRNTWQTGIGCTYLADPMSLKYLRRIPYRVGFSWTQLPYSLSGVLVEDWSTYFGSSLRVRNRTQLDIGLRLGTRGQTSGHNFQEQYVQLYVGTTLNNKWFIQTKYD